MSLWKVLVSLEVHLLSQETSSVLKLNPVRSKRMMSHAPQDNSPSETSQSSEETLSEQPIVIGNEKKNFWLFTEKDGFDLTRPDTSTFEQVIPRIRLETANSPITIAPRKTALVIVDMQNFALSLALNERHPGHDAENVLLKRAIPAAHKAGMQIIWLNWGVSKEDLKQRVTPTVRRIWTFDFDGNYNSNKGIGHDIGEVKLDSMSVQGGKFLMQGEWNTELHEPLNKAYQEGTKAAPPDVLFHKCAISGFSDKTQLSDFLCRGGFKTLLFAGINIEFCVLATLQDANLKGYDTVLLKDGCGTVNGLAASEAAERTCRKGWGFLSTCKDLEKGVENMAR